MVQRILDQRYELEELIGGGGMADVYKAKDRLLNRPVAVKILHEAFKQDKEFVDKFQREAQAAARLSHPNIVNIYDVGVADGDHYIVMEYVPGRTLKDRIRQEGHLSVSESLRVAREIAEALAHAHANNLVHCDIKPHNILMMADGHVIYDVSGEEKKYLTVPDLLRKFEEVNGSALDNDRMLLG